MGRPALHVRVRIQDTDIDLIAAHFKSKLLTFPNGRFSPLDEGERARFGAYALYRRAAEAVTVRAAATALLTSDDNASVMVLGDLNDEVEAATTQILNGPTGSEIGTGGFDQPDHGDRQRLWNLAPRIPADQRFSRIYRGRKELITSSSATPWSERSLKTTSSPTRPDRRPPSTTTPRKSRRTRI